MKTILWTMALALFTSITTPPAVAADSVAMRQLIALVTNHEKTVRLDRMAPENFIGFRGGKTVAYAESLSLLVSEYETYGLRVAVFVETGDVASVLLTQAVYDDFGIGARDLYGWVTLSDHDLDGRSNEVEAGGIMKTRYRAVPRNDPWQKTFDMIVDRFLCQSDDCLGG